LIHKAKLAWLKGPTPPRETNDLGIFSQELLGKLPVGKKVIADQGSMEICTTSVQKMKLIQKRLPISRIESWLATRLSTSISRT
jgi:hypothetical protein